MACAIRRLLSSFVIIRVPYTGYVCILHASCEYVCVRVWYVLMYICMCMLVCVDYVYVYVCLCVCVCVCVCGVHVVCVCLSLASVSLFRCVSVDVLAFR